MATIEELERRIDRKCKALEQGVNEAKTFAVVAGIASYAAAYFTLKPKDPAKAEETTDEPKQYVYHRRYR